MNSGKWVRNEYVEFCFVNWLYKFVQIYYRASPCTGKISTTKQIRMVKIHEFSRERGEGVGGCELMNGQGCAILALDVVPKNLIFA